MRITHLISNLEIGGAEGALCSLVEAQANMGVTHTVVSMLAGGALVPRVRAAGAHVAELTLTRSIGAATGLSSIADAIRQSRPDVVQGWMYHGNIAASVVRALGYYKCSLIWGVRQTTTRLSDDVPLTRLLIVSGALFSTSARHIVYNALSAAETHERWLYPNSKRVVIPNGIDCNRFRPRPGMRERLLAELHLPNNVLLVGRVARFSPMKDFSTLFAAFARVRMAEPRARLLLVGSGMVRENAELMNLWGSHGAPDGVHFLGLQLNIETFYPALNILISPSRSNEAFPNVIFEAIASGCPVVSTDVGNSSDVRELQTTVVAPGDVAALSEATLRVLAVSSESREQFAQNARILLEERFGLRKYAEAYLGVWRSALRRRPVG